MKVGIDSVLVVRFKKMKQLELFLEKNFTNYEIAYVNSKNKNKFETLAGLFAAKEAFLKALQIGLFRGIELKQIEVKHNNNGAPYINLSETIKQELEKEKPLNISLSITHTKKTATAICIIE